jgi:hypothetical protein
MVGTEGSYLLIFSRKIQPALFSFAVGDIKGPFDMCCGSGVV